MMGVNAAILQPELNKPTVHDAGGEMGWRESERSRDGGMERPVSPRPKALVWEAAPTLNTKISSCLLL
jgi:hypothetical protein